MALLFGPHVFYIPDRRGRNVLVILNLQTFMPLLNSFFFPHNWIIGSNHIVGQMDRYVLKFIAKGKFYSFSELHVLSYSVDIKIGFALFMHCIAFTCLMWPSIFKL